MNEPPRAKAHPGLTDRAFQSIPRLLYFSGLYGCPTVGDSQLGLLVDQSQLTQTSQVAKIKDYYSVLAMLGSFGVEVASPDRSSSDFARFPKSPVRCRSMPKRDAHLSKRTRPPLRVRPGRLARAGLSSREKEIHVD